jgi:hypothetical protein
MSEIICAISTNANVYGVPILKFEIDIKRLEKGRTKRLAILKIFEQDNTINHNKEL